MRIDPKLQSVLQKHFEEEIAEKDGHVHIVSSYKLSEDEIKHILSVFPKFQGHVIENAVDPSLVGGFTIQHGSTLIDMSIKNTLQTVKQRLYET